MPNKTYTAYACTMDVAMELDRSKAPSISVHTLSKSSPWALQSTFTHPKLRAADAPGQQY